MVEADAVRAFRRRRLAAVQKCRPVSCSVSSNRAANGRSIRAPRQLLSREAGVSPCPPGRPRRASRAPQCRRPRPREQARRRNRELPGPPRRRRSFRTDRRQARGRTRARDRRGRGVVIAPGHDACVIGDEGFVGFEFEERSAEESPRAGPASANRRPAPCPPRSGRQRERSSGLAEAVMCLVAKAVLAGPVQRCVARA
jgi:hypothetical protein